jgi:cell division protein FtsN
MSQTVKYILTVILIIAAAMWLITVYRSCENAKKNNTEITTDGPETEDENTATIDTTDSAGLEDLYDEEEDESDSTSDITTREEVDEGTSIDEDTSTDVEAEDDAFESRAGDYLVVAGAFVAKSNADRYQKQLIKKGYDAEVRIFLGSDYHSVILGDYATEGDALVVVKKLGGEAYVHKRRPLKKKK